MLDLKKFFLPDVTPSQPLGSLYISFIDSGINFDVLQELALARTLIFRWTQIFAFNINIFALTALIPIK